MAVLSEIQAGILTQDELVAGVIEQIVTVNSMFQVFPFDAIDGSALDLSDENELGAAGMTSVTGATANTGDFTFADGVAPAGNPITANALPAGFDADGATQGANFKSPATFNERTFRLKTILGDAEVNGLIQATYSGENDQEAVQIASKAKNLGRIYQACLVNGDETASGGLQFDGLLTLAAANGTTSGTAATALSFGGMDAAMDEVKDKDGQVDYIAAHARTRRSYKALLRGVGGATVDDVVTLENGDTVIAYEGVPLFRNDYIPTTQGGGSDTSMIFGTLDDGSRSYGVAGITAQNAAGIQVVPVGEKENQDATLNRVKWYAGLAQFSQLGLHVYTGISN